MYGNAKAIETVYNGYRFRSRVEARWAVFFDSLEIEYEYEPEGFDLTEESSKKPIWYLPDFYFPESDTFAEIKGKKPTEEEILKGVLLQKATKKSVLFLWGRIECPTGFDSNNAHYLIEEDGWDVDHHWLNCPRCEALGFGPIKEKTGCQVCGDEMRFDTLRLQKAYRKAKQARFEFDFRARAIQ